jgi:hypothetical protein
MGVFLIVAGATATPRPSGRQHRHKFGFFSPQVTSACDYRPFLLPPRFWIFALTSAHLDSSHYRDNYLFSTYTMSNLPCTLSMLPSVTGPF